jgi:hypothetical protein
MLIFELETILAPLPTPGGVFLIQTVRRRRIGLQCSEMSILAMGATCFSPGRSAFTKNQQLSYE